MPKKSDVEKLNPHYRKASKELILAYKRLGTVQKYFREGNNEEARKLVGHVKHYVHDALKLLGVTEAELSPIESEEKK